MRNLVEFLSLGILALLSHSEVVPVEKLPARVEEAQHGQVELVVAVEGAWIEHDCQERDRMNRLSSFKVEGTLPIKKATKCAF